MGEDPLKLLETVRGDTTDGERAAPAAVSDGNAALDFIAEGVDVAGRVVLVARRTFVRAGDLIGEGPVKGQDVSLCVLATPPLGDLEGNLEIRPGHGVRVRVWTAFVCEHW